MARDKDDQSPPSYILTPPPLSIPHVLPPILLSAQFQVFSKATEEDANGWWEATIKMIKGDFYVVAYRNTETSINEIVQKERLRIPNTRYVCVFPSVYSLHYKFPSIGLYCIVVL